MTWKQYKKTDDFQEHERNLKTYNLSEKERMELIKQAFKTGCMSHPSGWLICFAVKY